MKAVVFGMTMLLVVTAILTFIAGVYLGFGALTMLAWNFLAVDLAGAERMSWLQGTVLFVVVSMLLTAIRAREVVTHRRSRR